MEKKHFSNVTQNVMHISMNVIYLHIKNLKKNKKEIICVCSQFIILQFASPIVVYLIAPDKIE